MQITHVIRGEEWLSSAPKHMQLYEAFGWTPPTWVHPPLILDEKGKKLSKRSDTSTTFSSYIEEGYLPEAIAQLPCHYGMEFPVRTEKLYRREETNRKVFLLKV